MGRLDQLELLDVVEWSVASSAAWAVAWAVAWAAVAARVLSQAE